MDTISTSSRLQLGVQCRTSRPRMRQGRILPILEPLDRGRHTAWMLCAAFTSLIFAGFIGFGLLPPLEAASIGMVFLAAILSVAITPEMRRNPLHPLSLMLLTVVLNYGFRALEITVGHAPMSFLFLSDPNRYVGRACLLISASIVLYVLGYRSRIGASLARRVPLFYFPFQRSRMRGILTRMIIVYGVGYACQFYMLGLGAYHFYTAGAVEHNGLASVAHDLSMYTNIAFLGVLPLIFTNQAPAILLPILVFSQLVYGLMYGGATEILIPFVYIAAIYWLCRKPLAWRRFLVGWLLLLFIIAPMAMRWRYRYEAQAASPSFSVALASFTYGLSHPAWNDYSLALARYGRLDLLLAVLKSVPSVYPFQHGHTFLPYLEQILIPRILYPQKLVVTVGPRFRALFTGVEQGESAVSIGYAGESYFNFGYLGLAMCPLVGLLVRFFWDRLKVYSALEPAWTLRLYFLLFQVALGWEGLMAGYFGDLIRAPLELLVVMIFIYGRLPAVEVSGRRGI